MMPERQVFRDPAGKRWQVYKKIGATLGIITSIAALLLCISVLLLPSSRQQAIGAFHPFFLTSHDEAARKFLADTIAKKAKKQLAAEKPRRFKIHTGKPADTNNTVIGFYVDWDPNSFTSFRDHIDALTYVLPEWMSLNGGAVTFTSLYPPKPQGPDDTPSLDGQVVQLANAHRLPIMPILNNENADDFQWAPLRQLLTDPTRQQLLITRLRDYLLAQHFAGINIDFELPYDAMSAAELAQGKALIHAALPQFMQRLHDAFAPAHLLVSEDLPVDDANYDFAALGEANDLVIAMQYDQHTPTDPPGPIAGQDWLEQTAQTLFDQIDSSKVILGIGNYSYDWPVKLDANGAMTPDGAGREIQLGSALNIARQTNATVQMDDGDLNPYFFYTDADGQTHVVYMLDAVTAYNQVTALRGYAPRGAALWYLGSEDPTIWSFLDEDLLAKPASPGALHDINFQSTLDVDASPQGDELMQVSALATAGARTFITDSDGLITDEHYQSFPTPYVMQEFSGRGKTVALTFDDGPDAKYTPQILRVLKENHVNGTFFVIGEQAAQHPEIIRQSWQDGNEIGNHTYTHPHIDAVSSGRAEMELNSTQRIIESLTGHMSLLFRPPYGDSPDQSALTVAELPLIARLKSDGYLTVGMNIDPKDYLKPGVDAIVRQVEAQVSPSNHIILLHDGGGEREQTVAALPLIIKALKAQGYTFVTVSQLLGATGKDRLFPAVSKDQLDIAGFDQLLFEVWYFGLHVLQILFLVAIALGILRIVLFAPLVIANKNQARRLADASTPLPTVTVAIPAFNESRVVCRTVHAVLQSAYPDLRVVVVDDGSSDDTLARLREQFADHPQVTIVAKANGGKASALNAAFALAETEIVVCMDADTMFTPDTIRYLVRQFADPRVGAVAGNVKVGNRINLLTIWQSIEYITSQNFDRQAFSLLNSVAVVPGAVGAWRRSAVMKAGGFESSTLAEDTDLTFKIRLLGYATRGDNAALAYTEAPDTVGALAKQRFRWAFGILQALWKHRRQLWQPRYGAFSFLVMPSMWFFNIILQALAPLVDVMIVISLFTGQWRNVVFYAAIFIVLDLVASLLAFLLDGENPLPVLWLLWQRFFYRQFMYYIIIKALLAAVRGGIVGWGKLQRKDTVTLPG
jgi:cellulose synthase/poly-beta-1,6-N-acetylglucosamine synthase-like glycosyltransferase/peptidoglycan/xylan/chitin deacetylase (PgdA/CDA1 family)/spore germination protein YaaH